MYKIYCIEDINGLKYIGITKQILNQRFHNHKADRNRKSHSNSIKLDLDNSKIYIIEDDVKEENKEEREQYWIDKTNCVNTRNAVRDINKRKEWMQKHKEQLIEYHKQVYQDNRQKILQRKKELYNYKQSWGGDKRFNNNLLLIDTNLFN